MKKVKLLLVILWIGFILFQGIQAGPTSIHMSDKIVNPLVETIEKLQDMTDHNHQVMENSDAVVSDHLYRIVNYLIRKLAHGIEYAVLGVISFWMFRDYCILSPNKLIYTLLIVLVIAVCDEYLQSFVNRTSSVSDIMLDFSSGIVGMFIFYMGNQFIKPK